MDARLVEGVHQVVEALALLAQQPVGRDLAVLQEHLGVDDRALAHLAHRLAEADAGVVTVDHEGGDAPGACARSDRREDHVELGDAAVGDPRLLPVQDVARLAVRTAAVAMAAVSDPTPGSVEAERGERRPRAAQRRQPLLLLVGRADLDHWAAEEAAGGDQVADPGAAPVQLLLHDAAGQHVANATAADLLGEHEGGEPDLGRLVDDVDRRVGVALVDVGRDRPDLGPRELARKRLDLALVVGQIERLGSQFDHGRDGTRPAFDRALAGDVRGGGLTHQRRAAMPGGTSPVRGGFRQRTVKRAAGT